jgi:hypothetical protein
MTHHLHVGSVVISKANTGVCKIGEPGVVYEVYAPKTSHGSRSEYGVIFAAGLFDGFSLDEVNAILYVPGLVCAEAAGYRFDSVPQLHRDYQAGKFNVAFAMGARFQASWDSSLGRRQRKLDVTIEDLRAAKNRKPFQPFVIALQDGRRVEVASPYTIEWGPDQSRTMVVITSTERREVIDLEAITSLNLRAALSDEMGGR